MHRCLDVNYFRRDNILSQNYYFMHYLVHLRGIILYSTTVQYTLWYLQVYTLVARL